MANGLHINPILFNKYIKNLEKKLDKKLDQVDDEFYAGVEEIATNAKKLAPTDESLLTNSIYVRKDRKLSYILIANTRYAAYVEFGTGKYAKTYVQGLEEYWKKLARKYYKNGKGKSDKQPFFYPSVSTGLPIIYNRIKNILKAK